MRAEYGRVSGGQRVAFDPGLWLAVLSVRDKQCASVASGSLAGGGSAWVALQNSAVWGTSYRAGPHVWQFMSAIRGRIALPSLSLRLCCCAVVKYCQCIVCVSPCG